LTLVASDEGGLTDFTNLIVYLNTTIDYGQNDALFKCSTQGVRSELNQSDKKTLVPPLYVLVSQFFFLINRFKIFI
jgi:hypothetical protein